FLGALKKHKMDIWGLDQEYFSAVFFLYDELLDLAKGKSNFQEIETHKKAATLVTKQWMIKDDASEYGIQVFKKILEEPAVQSFFKAFDEADVLAQQMIKDLKISWDIYNRYLGGASHQDRLDYIRANFLKSYQKAKSQKSHPKVFVKVGSLHAFKNPIGGPDVGSLVQELAQQNATQSTHLHMITRYRRVDGQLIDHLKTNPKRYGRYELFLNTAQPGYGLLIDLRTIREELKQGKVKYPKDPNSKYWKTIIENFDFQVVLPTDYPATALNC
ncbi:MAG: hypothetical protein AAF705_14500, partial [Bacteroidota bacterium]